MFSIFHVSLGHLYVIFGEVSFQIPCPFFNQIGVFFCFCYLFLLLSVWVFLYILDISPISNIWFVNIFSHLAGCLFIFFFFWWFPLLCWSFLVDVVPLVYAFFCHLCFWKQVQKIIAKIYIKEFTTMFSSRSFMNSGPVFKFNSSIHLN